MLGNSETTTYSAYLSQADTYLMEKQLRWFVIVLAWIGAIAILVAAGWGALHFAFKGAWRSLADLRGAELRSTVLIDLMFDSSTSCPRDFILQPAKPRRL